MDETIGKATYRYICLAAVIISISPLLVNDADAEIVGPPLPTTATRAGSPIIVEPGDDVTGTQRTTSDPSRSLAVPKDGVIQAFNVHLGSGFTAGPNDQVLYFSVLRPHVEPGQYLVVALAGPYAGAPNTVNRYPVSIPVTTGDQVGFGWRGASAIYNIDPILLGQGGDAINVAFTPISPGQVVPFQNLADIFPDDPGYQRIYMPINAEFEPTAVSGPDDAPTPVISDLKASSKCVLVKGKRRHTRVKKSASSKRSCKPKSKMTFKLSLYADVNLAVSRVLAKSRGYRPKDSAVSTCKRLSKKRLRQFKRNKSAKRRFFKKNRSCSPLLATYGTKLSGTAGENSYTFKGKFGSKRASQGLYEFDFGPAGSESHAKIRIRVIKKITKK